LLIVWSVVSVDFVASQEYAPIKRTQLTCREDQHSDIEVDAGSRGT